MTGEPHDEGSGAPVLLWVGGHVPRPDLTPDASSDFPTVGSRRRAWCGETINVIGLTLNARRPILHCHECNQHPRQLAGQHRSRAPG